jgi:hypothetical protein
MKKIILTLKHRPREFPLANKLNEMQK